MASSFPGGLDSFTNPTASDTLDSVTVPHADQHANANDAIEAIESTLGTNPQGGSASVSARLTALDSTVAGKVASVTAGDSTVTIAGTSTAPEVKVNQANLTITESQVTNLVSDLAGKAPATGISPSAITGTAVVVNPTASQTIVNSASDVVPLSVNQSGQAHTLTARLSATSGSDITALNVVSSNPYSSAVWISGKEYGHGTLKVAHLQPESGSDANAAAISINLACDTTRGPAGDITATQGIYLDTYQVADNSIKYGTTGNLLNIKNAGTQRLVLNSNGQLQLPTTDSTGGLVIGGDVKFWRSSPKVLRSDSTMYLQSATANTVLLYTTQTSGLGPAAAAFSVQNNGKLSWGPSVNSSSVADTNLYRNGVGTLKTDNNFVASTVTATIDGGSA